MELRIESESFDCLEDYARIPISFEVRSQLRLDLVDDGLGGMRLVEEPVDPPWVKDYDASAGDRPLRWRRWDLTNWELLSAYDGDERVGGAVLARDTEGVNFLEGRNDLAALWDIRVAPSHRGSGIGSALFKRVVDSARTHGCAWLKIETQNINVPACRFYVAMGCRLGTIIRHAYDDFPEEAELNWYYDLTGK